MRQPILLHSLIVEPRTITSLPLDAANHAKLRFTPASHVVAAFLQLHRRAAVVAALPSFLLGNFDELSRRVISGADATAMPAAVAGDADFRPTSRTFSVSPPRVSAAAGINVDISRFDPFAASTRRTIEAVLGGVFLVFLIPFHFEFGVEELVNVFEGDVVGGAASWGHVLGIGEGKGEDASEAGVTHAVIAGETSGAGGGVGGEAGQALDSGGDG
ncbi:MAG: hypothetical protein Q9225_007143 [Loekoesia sp. 1 TL-2023]